MLDKTWYLRRNQLFAELTADRLQDFQRICRMDRFLKGSPVYSPVDVSDAVFVVATGRIRICHLTHDGKRSTLAFVDPGEVFGELAVLDDTPREEYAEAAKESSVIRIPVDRLNDLLKENPDVALRFLHLIAQRRKRLERRLRNLLFCSSRDRLIHLLLELAEKYGAPADNGVRLTTDLSHQDLASMIGSTRETVTLVLGDLQSDGLIKLGRRKITLLQPEEITGLVRRITGQTPESVFGQVSSLTDAASAERH
jgi:CRP-like cAMP-binding protein